MRGEGFNRFRVSWGLEFRVYVYGLGESDSTNGELNARQHAKYRTKLVSVCQLGPDHPDRLPVQLATLFRV